MKKNTVFLIFIILVSILILGKTKDPDLKKIREPEEIFPKLGKFQTKGDDWSEPVNISNTSSDSMEPLVGADQEGNAYVVWVEFANQKIIYSNTNESGKWANLKKVTQMPTWVEGPSPSFIVQNSGTGHLVYIYRTPEPNYEIFYNSYSNGTWSNNLNVSQGVGGSCYPSISVDNNNQYLYFVWQDGRIREWEIMIRFKKPDSSKWNNIKTLPLGSNRVYIPEITIDGNGTAHVVWCDRTQAMNSTVWYSKNPQPTDISKWTSPIPLSNGTNLRFCWPKIASDNEGNVYVVWEDKSQGNMEIFFRKKINGVWEDIENISNTSQTSQQPTIAVDKNSGNIYVVWQERAGNWQVFFKYYQNGQWSQSINLTNNSSASINPNLWIDDAGEIHLVYADNFRGPYEIMYTSTREPAPQVYPPINVSLETKLDNSQTEKINILTWEENPENKNLEIINYKIYRKEVEQKDDEYILIKSVTGETFEYEDKNLPTTKKYSYSLTAVAQGGYESEASEWVTEEKVFPPINITLNTEINSSLFSDEKINIICWNKNPLNDAITVINYNLYRKKSDQEDKHYVVISTKDANTFEYMDRDLPLDEKFTYMMIAVDSNGNVSKKSESVSEN